MAADIHAVVVGVKSAQRELHADNIGDGATVLDAPSLVVASNRGPPSRVGVVPVHQSSGLLREGFASRVPVFQREELVKQLVENPANGLASGT